MLVLLSGGLDSTVLLHKVCKAVGSKRVRALTLDYGQLHAKEIECAQWQAETCGVPWKLLDIKSVFDGIYTPLLGVGEIPDKTYKEQLDEKEGRVTTYVPNRNMILLSIAAAHAMASQLELIANQPLQVAYAAHMDDAERGAYPDCTPLFYARMDHVLKTQGVALYAPFIEEKFTKSQIVGLGLDLGVNFAHTWSCYRGEDKACGHCGTCVSENSLILMEDLTQKPIKDIQVGDRVWSRAEYSRELKVSTVTQVVCHGERTMHDIGGLHCTSDHKLWARSEGGNFTWREVQSLKRKDANYQGLRWRDGIRHLVDDEAFALGYMRGLIEGDGHIDRGVFLCQKTPFVITEFWELYDQYIAACDVTTHWDERREIYTGVGGYAPLFKRRTAFQADNAEYCRGYLNGMLIAEGCAAFNKSNGSFGITLAQSLNANAVKCAQIEQALETLDIRAIRWDSVGGGYTNGNTHMQNWRFTSPQRLPLVYGADKLNSLRSAMEQHPSQLLEHAPLNKNTLAYESMGAVYDIATTEHTFFANGFLVHNCYDRRTAFKANGAEDPLTYAT